MSPSIQAHCQATLLACLLLAVGGARASEDFAVRLDQAQQQYAKQIETGHLTLQQLYLARLRDLEAKAVEEQAYEEAKAYHQDAKAFLTELGSKASEPLTLTLFLEDAEQAGTTLSVERTVTWKLPNIPLGGYQIIIHYQGNAAPLAANLAASHYFIKGDLPPASTETGKVTLGDLRIIADAPSLTLTLSNLSKEKGSFEISQIELISHAP